MPDHQDLIAEWCEYHHTVNSISHDRRVAQLRVLRELESQLSGPIELVDARDLERYISGMVAAGYHAHTVVHNLRLIRPFLRALWKQGKVDAERWLRLLDVKPPRGAYDGQPRPYTRREIRQFWEDLEARYPWTLDRETADRTPERGEYWVRRWAAGQSKWIRVYPYARRLQVEAIVSLALYGGLRRGEIYAISLDDMHYHNEYVRVASRKGPNATEKVRVVPMNDAIMLAVGNWIEFRSQVLQPPHDFPWLNLWAGAGANKTQATDPLGDRNFQGMMGKMGRGWSLHRLRHTFATERYRAGMPVEVLQPVLGHATIRQTLAYAKVTEDRIIEVSRQTDAGFLDAIKPPTKGDE